MTVVATASNPRFSVSRVDIERPGPTYTADTLSDIRAQPGEARSVLHHRGGCAGPDPDLASGRRAVRTGPLRGRHPARHRAALGGDPQLPPDKITLIEVPALAISSTDCRARVEEPGADLVPRAGRHRAVHRQARALPELRRLGSRLARRSLEEVGHGAAQDHAGRERNADALVQPAHDLPTPPPPVLHPGTGQPVGPDDLAPLFPMELILQEVSTSSTSTSPRRCSTSTGCGAHPALPSAPAGDGARHARADLLQVRGRLAGRLAQAQHRGPAGVLQREGRHPAADHRDRRRPVGYRIGVRLRPVRARVRDLAGRAATTRSRTARS